MKVTASKPDNMMMYSLLLGVHLCALPHYPGMPASVLLLIFLLSIWQIHISRNYKTAKPVSKILLISIIFITLPVILYSYGNIFGQQPGFALITIMTVLKLFETKAPRDCYIVIYSTFFILASNFFNSQSVWLILYVFFVIIFQFSTLITLSDRLGTTSPIIRLRMSSRFMVLSIPLMLILFVLFPRIPGPLWALPDDAFSNRTGLSEEMSPGSINRLISSSAIAFRVKFDNDIPDHSQRYWRGAVLSFYDGRTWKRSDAPGKTQPNLDYGSVTPRLLDYEVTLEPTNLNWLLSLDYPRQWNHSYQFTREAMLTSTNKITNVISYRIQSQSNAVNRSLFEQEDYKNRLLPVAMNPRTIELSRTLLEEAGFGARSYIKKVLAYFTDNAFIYTLNPDLLGKDAMDEFLFDSRRGFCEHYASSFVYLMRAVGIPARVVVGYQGGVMNPLDDYMIVRQSDAHAWAEVWINNRWTRIDPTAAVSPDRIEQGVLNAGLEPSGLPLLLLSENDLIKNMAYLYDSFQNNWNQWVVGFNQKKQNDLLKSLGFEKSDVSTLIFLLVCCMSIVGFIVTFIVLKQKTGNRDRVQHYYNLFCLKLEKHGLRRQLNEGPLDFENRILRETSLASHTSNDLIYIFKAYRSLHYGNHSNANLLHRYIKKVRSFRMKS